MRSPSSVNPPPRGDSRGGYVLVALLASSAVLLAALALAVPRMAVQAQRVKEETLVYRGKQYERAIELYYRAHKKYPEKLDDLEETDGVRYLRKRYKDPLTGEDEWRLIHIGTDGRFKDSLIYDLAEEVEGDGFGAAFGGSSGLPGLGGLAQGQDAGGLASGGRTEPDDDALKRIADRRRAAAPPPPVGQFQGGARSRAVRRSAAPDQTQQARYGQGFEFPVGAQAADGQPQPGGGPGGRQPPPPTDYSAVLPSQIPMYENQPPLPDPNAPFGRQGRQPARGPNRGPPGFSGLRPSAAVGGLPRPGSPGYGTGAAPAGQFPAAPGGLQVTVGGPSAAFGAQGISTGATSIIQRLLTTPRPGGLAGLQAYGQAQQPEDAASPPAAFQEGIAGVASRVEDFGVKTYKGREIYSEWEFVYDYRKDAANGGAAGGAGAANRGTAGGIAPTAQQGTAASPYPASQDGRLGGYGAPSSRAPGTPGLPGYGGLPGAAGPYYPPNPEGAAPPAEDGPYPPTATPPPYGTVPGAPQPPYGVPPDAIDPRQQNLPDGPRPPGRPPAPDAGRRGR